MEEEQQNNKYYGFVQPQNKPYNPFEQQNNQPKQPVNPFEQNNNNFNQQGNQLQPNYQPYSNNQVQSNFQPYSNNQPPQNNPQINNNKGSYNPFAQNPNNNGQSVSPMQLEMQNSDIIIFQVKENQNLKNQLSFNKQYFQDGHPMTNYINSLSTSYIEIQNEIMQIIDINSLKNFLSYTATGVLQKLIHDEDRPDFVRYVHYFKLYNYFSDDFFKNFPWLVNNYYQFFQQLKLSYQRYGQDEVAFRNRLMLDNCNNFINAFSNQDQSCNQGLIMLSEEFLFDNFFPELMDALKQTQGNFKIDFTNFQILKNIIQSYFIGVQQRQVQNQGQNQQQMQLTEKFIFLKLFQAIPLDKCDQNIFDMILQQKVMDIGLLQRLREMTQQVSKSEDEIRKLKMTHKKLVNMLPLKEQQALKQAEEQNYQLDKSSQSLNQDEVQNLLQRMRFLLQPNNKHDQKIENVHQKNIQCKFKQYYIIKHNCQHRLCLECVVNYLKCCTSNAALFNKQNELFPRYKIRCFQKDCQQYFDKEDEMAIKSLIL